MPATLKKSARPVGEGRRPPMGGDRPPRGPPREGGSYRWDYEADGACTACHEQCGQRAVVPISRSVMDPCGIRLQQGAFIGMPMLTTQQGSTEMGADDHASSFGSTCVRTYLLGAVIGMWVDEARH